MNRDMNHALKLLDWPSQLNKSSQKTIQGLDQLRLAVKKLSVFQKPAGATTATVMLPSSEASGPLLPFKVMAKEIDIRFRYHFEGNRTTNNIEKVHHLQSSH
jgi:RINT-1 / TIP-1 family